MILSNLAASPVYRLRASNRVNAYGDDVEDWTEPEKLRLRRAVVQEVSSEEVETGTRRLLTDERTLIVEGEPDLTADDRIEYRGDVWRVQGDPITRPALGSATQTVASLRGFGS